MKVVLFKFILCSISALYMVFLIETAFRFYGYVHQIDLRLYLQEIKNSNRLPAQILGTPLNNPSQQALATTSDFSVIYKINSKGLRDKEYDYEKPTDVKRIIAFGDSFTFGEGVTYGKRYTDVLENNLHATEVLNFGYPGASLDKIAVLIAHEGISYNPDYVIIFLNNLVTDRGDAIYNDLFDSTESAALLTDPSFKIMPNSGRTVYMNNDDPFFNYKPGFLLRHSYALAYLNYRLTVFRLLHNMQYEDDLKWKKISFWLSSKAGPDFLQNTDIKNRTVNILNKIHTFLSNRGIELVVVNIDTTPLIHFYSSTPPFTYLDLHEKLLNEKEKYNLTFTYDQHYNERTNLYIAEQMTEVMKQLSYP